MLSETDFCVENQFSRFQQNFSSDDGWQRHQLDLPLGEHQQPEPGHLGLGGQGRGQQGPGRHWQSGHDRGGGGGEEEAQPRKQGFILQQQRRFCHLFRGQICHFLSHFFAFLSAVLCFPCQDFESLKRCLALPQEIISGHALNILMMKERLCQITARHAMYTHHTMAPRASSQQM